jgi:Na+-transporting NADH:ubiquinone oxidoreductase subunit NqrA
MPKLNVVVSRFESYPKEKPTSWVVGFLCTLENGKQFYVEDIVNFVNVGDEEEAVEYAWQSVQEQVNQKVQELLSKSGVTGRQFEVEL